MYENIYGEPTGTPEGREVIYVKEEAKPQYWQMETVMTEKRREAVCVIEEGNLKKRYLSIEGDIVCVSSVAGASKELQEWAKRKNVWLVSPDTGKTAIRNRDGQIEAVRQFVLHVAAE